MVVQSTETPSQPSVSYPVRLEAEYQETYSRGLALLGALVFLKALLLIPHLVILYILGIASAVLAWVGYLVILFTGKQPRGVYHFNLGVLRWQTRTTAWLLSISDKYPPFTMK
ncbi:MAG: DUF4389 domain-containing protein [SAR202 cluster bacterium]|nr:DUF4389 domain-containing protein [SAR202 cluster bacterium]